MEKALFQDYPEKQRRSMLEDNADKVEEIGYMKPFTPEEMEGMKDDLSKVVIGINDIEEEKKSKMDEIKMNRSYFENRQYAMELVTLLRQFKAKIDKQVEADVNPNKGDRRVLIAQKVDSNLPPAFNIIVPIFKGTEKMEIECETYFNPDDLTCTLVSAGANDSIEDMKDSCVGEVLEQIKEIAPDVAIIEM